jgi:pimeloyl-ACP methyl ester carboxylesterase
MSAQQTVASAAQPFEIAVPDAEVEDLRNRLRRTRYAEDFDNDDWRFGMQGAYLRELVDYWIEEYDWRGAERDMNRYPHFTAEIDGMPIHWLFAQGKGKRTLPIILSHGWPWSFWDFKDLIGLLSDPAAHGLDDDLAFDVVAPSLPGFGFSSPLRRSGIGPLQVADVWQTLMVDVLGYERFLAHGGDWGSFVTANLAHAHADRLIGAHLSMPIIVGFDRTTLSEADYGPGEEEWFGRMTRKLATATAHAIVHRASPQTLGFAFNDSPVGLASWIVERRRLWSDCGGDVERVFSKDFLLTLLSIYWFTQSVHTSMRAYTAMGWTLRHDRSPVMEAPLGVAVFPEDIIMFPRAKVAEHTNLVHWSVMDAGGHFAAAEQPGPLAADIRAFTSKVI